MTTSPLERLRNTSTALDAATLDGFVRAHGRALVLVAGDPTKRPEAQDAAVVSRELARQIPGLSVGVVVSPDEEAVKQRLGITAVPAVVLYRDGQVGRSLERMQDWTVYARAADEVFGPGSAP